MLSKTVSTSRKVNRLSDRAALLYTWLIPHTDDFGHTEGDALTIKGKVVPMRSNTIQEIEQDLELIEANDLLTQYEVEGEKYIEIKNFEAFQTFRSDRKMVAEYPGINGMFPQDNRLDTTGIPMGRNSFVREGKVREGKVREGKRESTLEYLSKIPNDHVKEITDRFIVTEKQLKSKAEDLLLYCKSKKKTYRDYKAFLLNAVKKDFKEKADTSQGGKYKNL